LQIRALREYATRRGWTIALQVKEIGSGASQRQLREKLLDAARRREIDVVLVWRLDRWGRSVTDLLATLQELEHLGVGFVSLTEALNLTTPAGRWPPFWPSSPSSSARFYRSGCAPAWPTLVRTESVSVGRQPRHAILLKSGNYIARASANPKSPAACRLGGHRYGAFWWIVSPSQGYETCSE
jgi:resolvase-like protein